MVTVLWIVSNLASIFAKEWQKSCWMAPILVERSLEKSVVRSFLICSWRVSRLLTDHCLLKVWFLDLVLFLVLSVVGVGLVLGVGLIGTVFGILL